MKIVMILCKDTNNFTMHHFAKYFTESDHSIDFYSLFLDKNHLYMFQDMDITIKDAALLTSEILEKYDIAITYPNLFAQLPNLIYSKTYIFAFDNHYLDEPVIGVDCMFERGSGWRPKLLAGHRAECTYMVVGEPKHDTWNFQNVKEKKNRILFIDSGHYPFGLEGKTKVAEFLLKAAEKFPAYEIIVKPRVLKGDSNVTHANKLLLYDVIDKVTGGQLPSNLILLQEHLDLNELIASAHTVVCMYTTAYIDAAVQGKGLIILQNLPNEENAEVRIETHWKIAEEIMKSSGCLVDYRDALKYLPEGIHCSEKHLQEQIYSTGHITQKIANTIEWLWEKYLSKHHYPKPVEYFYDSAPDIMCTDEYISMERLIELRQKNYLFCWERAFYKNTIFFPGDSKVSDCIEQLDQTGALKNNTLEQSLSIISNKLLEYAKQIPIDRISQSYLFAQILSTGNLKRIFDIPAENIVCRDFYHFISGRAYYEDKKYQEACQSFELFLDERNQSDYTKSLGDMMNYKLSAAYYCGMAYFNLKKYEKAQLFFLQCQELTNNRHGKAKEQLDLIKSITEGGNR